MLASADGPNASARPLWLGLESMAVPRNAPHAWHWVTAPNLVLWIKMNGRSKRVPKLGSTGALLLGIGSLADPIKYMSWISMLNLIICKL